MMMMMMMTMTTTKIVEESVECEMAGKQKFSEKNNHSGIMSTTNPT
jgi:hypothetical protein